MQPSVKRKHAWFKAFLDAELKMPYKVICGDNWYSGFIECFGSRNFAFDAKGFHFVFTSLPKERGETMSTRSDADCSAMESQLLHQYKCQANLLVFKQAKTSTL